MFSGISKFLRIGITLILIVVIYSKISLTGMFSRIIYADPALIFLAGIFYGLGQYLSIIKWRLFLRSINNKTPTTDLVRAYLIGMFVNTFGIGTVGGDVARALSMPKEEEGGRSRILATVIADRVHGLLVLISIGAISLILIRPNEVPDYIPIGLVIGVILISLVLLITPKLLSKKLAEKSWYKGKIKGIIEGFPRNPETIIKATLVSLLFHTIQIFMAVIIFSSLANPIDVGLAFRSIPFVNAASALPLSINGLGIREAVSVYMLRPSGVSSEISVSFAAVWLLIVTIVSGIGGLIVTQNYKISLSEFKQENKN